MIYPFVMYSVRIRNGERIRRKKERNKERNRYV